jgi:site-specific recombinase XerD
MTATDLIEIFSVHLRAESKTARTIADYTYFCRRADEALPYDLDCATEEELRTYIWRGEYAPASRALRYAALKAFFVWAVECDYLDFNPMGKIKRPKVNAGVPRVAADHIARMVLTDAKEPHRLHAKLAAYAGARCIEIHRLRREDITAEYVTLRGKGDKDRQVPTHPVIWAAVANLPVGPITDLPDAKAVSNRFTRYCQAHYGIRFSLHRLRGWFATTAYNATKDPRAIQVLLGHADLSTTTRYILSAIPQQRAVVDGLPTFDAEDGDPPVSGPPVP